MYFKVTLNMLDVVQIKDRTLLKQTKCSYNLWKGRTKLLKNAGCDSNHPRKHHMFALLIIFSFPALKKNHCCDLLTLHHFLIWCNPTLTIWHQNTQLWKQMLSSTLHPVFNHTTIRRIPLNTLTLKSII